MMAHLSQNDLILGVIIAGGGSRRMGGQDKFLMRIGKRRIIDHIVARLAPQVDHLIVNANRKGLEDRITNEVVPDSGGDDKRIGPIGGLLAALNYAKTKGYDLVVTVPADTPFIPDNLVEKLVQTGSDTAVIAKSAGRLHPTIGLWPLCAYDSLAKAARSNNLKLMDYIEEQKITAVEWPQHPDPFFNINTAEDLKQAREIFSNIP